MLMLITKAMAETTEVAADGAAVSTAGSLISTVIMIAVMVAVMYFLMIRPQRKKEKAVKNMLDALKPKDKICTIGGLYGTVTSIQDDKITISLGREQVPVVIARWAVRSVEDAPLENDAEPEI